MNDTDENNETNMIRKKSSFLRDGSYRIFYITKKSKDENEDDISRKSTEKKDFLTVNEKRESTHLIVHREKLKRNHRRRSTFQNLYPQTQASLHRRRQPFLVACATVFIALMIIITIIITIVIYVIIKTVKYNTEMNRHLRNHPC